jgi:hypothetical protein
MEPAQRNAEWSRSWLQEMLRFPHRRFAIDSQLPLDAAVERIRGIIQPGGLVLAGLFGADKLFVGEAFRDHLRLRRIRPYQNQSMPIIEGRFEPTPTGTRLALGMRLPRRTVAGALVWFVIGGALLISSVLGPLLSPHMKGSLGFTLFTAVLVAGGYAMIAAGFNTEVAKTQEIMREALQTRPSERIEEALHPNAARRNARVIKSARGFAFALGGTWAMVFLILPAFMGHSEKFRVARQYVEADALIRSELGNVTAVEPDRWRSGQENYLGTQEGNASFSIEVTGTNDKGVVSVQMQKHLGIWKVMSAKLQESNGRTIALGESGN